MGDALLVADIGGTNARFALADPHAATPLLADSVREFPVAAFPSLAEAAAHYLDQVGTRARRGVFAVAGRVEADVVRVTNHPWVISRSRTSNALGFSDLHLINDFAAQAMAIRLYTEADVVQIGGTSWQPAAPDQPRNYAVIGPGTGLGAAVWIEGQPPRVLPTEVGQASLAAGNALELDIVRLLLRDRPYLHNEHVLSGPGLMNLYRCLCELRGASPVHADAGALVAAAASDALARETLETFCGWLGSVVGDLAIIFGARVVYLAGGVTAHIPQFLHDGRFLQRYLNKGVMTEQLERVPVWRVEHGQLGLLGAVAWYRQNRKA